jgi:outer membrane cobalamin receptor
MSLSTSVVGAVLIATALFVSAALAGKPADQQPNERTVFVTGSLIPQRIKLKPVGTTTVSPVRIIDRREIDATGRRTAAGIFVADPSVRVVGH